MTESLKAAGLPSLDHFFSLGEDAFKEIVARVTPMNPQTLVELGSGRSTVRFASALDQTRIYSIESGPAYAAETRTLLDRHGLDNAVVIEVPIRRQLFGLALYDGFDLNNRNITHIPEKIDVLFIDGPPGACFGGREAALYALFGRVRTGGLIILDDLCRKDERRAVRHWQNRFPGAFEVDFSETGHHLAYLTKIANPGFRRISTVPWSHYGAALWGYALKYSEPLRSGKPPA
jgi:predicted O-methyltransferase YrrM